MRVCISCEKPAITALTTIIVATPSITLTTLARAIQRVRRYRQQRRSLYIAKASLPESHGDLRRECEGDAP